MIRWENDEVTSEPLDQFAKDDPVSCAQYALENDLLSKEGWKRFLHIAKNQKKLKRMVRQAKLRSYKTSPKDMFGFQIPRNYAEALKLDEHNGNTRWQDCTKLELHQLQEYKFFRDQGKDGKIPQGYKKIRTT